MYITISLSYLLDVVEMYSRVTLDTHAHTSHSGTHTHTSHSDTHTHTSHSDTHTHTHTLTLMHSRHDIYTEISRQTYTQRYTSAVYTYTRHVREI